MQLMNDNNGVSVKIFDHPQFYVQNFTSRWEKARISSLQNFLHDLIIEKNLQEQSSSEDLLLELVTAENKESVFRSVFDCSRKFGMNASRFF